MEQKCSGWRERGGVMRIRDVAEVKRVGPAIHHVIPVTV